MGAPARILVVDDEPQVLRGLTAALSAAVLHAHDHEQDEHREEYRYYPVQWNEPYLGRRRAHR